MMDLHDAFTRWLVSGQEGSLPRDVAVHASACPGCLRATGAFDALAYVDVASAPEPRVEEVVHADQRSPLVRGSMLAAGASLLLVIATTGAMAVSGAFGPAVPDLAAVSTSATPGGSVIEGVLGNQRSPAGTGTERPTPSTDASPQGSDEADPSAEPGSGIVAPDPTPTLWGPPLPATSDGPVPPPSSRPSRTPHATSVATATSAPTASPAPTPTPTPIPTPDLTPTPTPESTPNPTELPLP
jgi:hypothetical protein